MSAPASHVVARAEGLAFARQWKLRRRELLPCPSTAPFPDLSARTCAEWSEAQ